MKLPRDVSRERLAETFATTGNIRGVHQLGSYIILKAEEPSHQRIAVPGPERSANWHVSNSAYNAVSGQNIRQADTPKNLFNTDVPRLRAILLLSSATNRNNQIRSRSLIPFAEHTSANLHRLSTR
jgi:hypothetical protein